MSRTLKINGTDYTSVWRQEESNFAARAHYGESVQSQFVIDDDEGSAVTHVDLASRKVVELWEDASGTNLCLWRGRMMNHTVGRGDKLMGDARQWQCNAEDYNIDLRGIRVVNSVRPAETDVARVLAFRAAYLNGTASSNVHHRASTTMGTAYVAAGGTVNLTAETYTDTFPDEVLRRIAEMSGKDYFVVVDTTDASAELFYDVATSTAFASDISITDAGTADGVNSFAPIYVSAPGSHEGQETLSGGGIRYNGGAGFYEESNIVSGETNHDKWEEHFTDDYVATEAEASTLLTRIVTARDNEHINFSVRLKMRDTQVHRIRSGMTLSVRLGAANLETAATLRAVQVILYPEGPGWYLVDVELGWPRDTPVIRTRRSPPRAPTPPTPPASGSAFRLYFTASPTGVEIEPDADWDAFAWSSFFPPSTVAASQLTDNPAAGGADGTTPWATVSPNVNDDIIFGQETFPLTGTLLAAIQAGGATIRMQAKTGSRFGLGVSEATQDILAQMGVRVVSSDGSTVRGTALALHSLTASTGSRWPPQSTKVNRVFPPPAANNVLSAVAGAQDGDLLVIEVGGRNFKVSGATGGNVALDSTAAYGSDLPENETETQNLRAWIEIIAAGSAGTPGDVPGATVRPGDESAGTQTGTFAPIDHVHAHGLLSTSETRYHDDTHIEVTGTDGVKLGANVADALDVLASKLDGGTDGQVLTKQSDDDYDVDWETPSGGGGGSGSSLPLLIGEPSSFSGSADKDFRGAASLSPYTAGGATSGSVALLETDADANKYQITAHGLLVQCGSGDTATFRADYELPNGRSMILAVTSPRHTTGDNSSVGLRLSDNATFGSGTHVTAMLEQDSTEWVVQANSSANAAGAEMTQQEVEIPHLLLFRIARNSLTYSMWVSMDGGAWGYMGFQATVGAALDRVWFWHTVGTMQTYAPAILVPFIVEGANDYLPW